MGLVEFGPTERTMAGHEMPGLMNCQKEWGPSQPFKGMRINGLLHMTIQTDVLIKTAMSPNVLWYPCNFFSN